MKLALKLLLVLFVFVGAVIIKLQQSSYQFDQQSLLLTEGTQVLEDMATNETTFVAGSPQDL